jgi:hypothetical protein
LELERDISIFSNDKRGQAYIDEEFELEEMQGSRT